jgi:MFS family permease
VVLGLSMAVLDGSIANLALPAMAADLKASNADAIWVINSYQIAMAVCLLPLASLEVIGYRRVYLGGLFLFTLASLACAASGDMLQLSLARVLQGLGAAGILSVNTALIRFIYPARQLGRAIGYNALVAGTGNALGPGVAGLILHLASWHWLFLINIPLGLAALAVGRALPANPLSPRRFDTQSALLCMGFIGLLLYTIDAVGHCRVAGWWRLRAAHCHQPGPAAQAPVRQRPHVAAGLAAHTAVCALHRHLVLLLRGADGGLRDAALHAAGLPGHECGARRHAAHGLAGSRGADRRGGRQAARTASRQGCWAGSGWR